MKIINLKIPSLHVVLIWVGLFCVNSSYGFEQRTWTSITGASIEAEFVEREFSIVVLKKGDGKSVKIPYSKLSKSDQKYVTEASKPGATTGANAAVPQASQELVELFGKNLYSANKKKVNSGNLSDKIIGVYFSASWCPPCRGFTPDLVKAYEELKSKGKPFELVLVSSDSSKKDAFGYMKDYNMTWLMVDHGGDESDVLKARFGTGAIPNLVIINDAGEVISKNGWAEVRKYGAEAFDKWE